MKKPMYDRAAMEKEIASRKSRIASLKEAVSAEEKAIEELRVHVQRHLVFERHTRDKKAACRIWRAGEVPPKRKEA